MRDVLRGTVVNPEKIYGKSAYEIAVAHGFDGTEEEWLASLTDMLGNNAYAGLRQEKQEALKQIYDAQERAVSNVSRSGYLSVIRYGDGNVTASITGTGEMRITDDGAGNITMEVF